MAEGEGAGFGMVCLNICTGLPGYSPTRGQTPRSRPWTPYLDGSWLKTRVESSINRGEGGWLGHRAGIGTSTSTETPSHLPRAFPRPSDRCSLHESVLGLGHI